MTDTLTLDDLKQVMVELDSANVELHNRRLIIHTRNFHDCCRDGGVDPRSFKTNDLGSGLLEVIL
jgi:hypothetical protein